MLVVTVYAGEEDVCIRVGTELVRIQVLRTGESGRARLGITAAKKHRVWRERSTLPPSSIPTRGPTPGPRNPKESA